MENVYDNRDNAISCVRCVAMLMIVLCHFFQYFGLELAWWLNVGVQIFLVVSGFLYGEKAILEPLGWLLKQTKKILIPYWVYVSLLILIYAAKGNMSFMSAIRLLTCSGTVAGVQHFWFIPYILFCYAMTPFLFWVRERYAESSLKKMIAAFSVILVLVVLEGTLMGFFFQPSYVICYIIGYLLAILNEKCERRKIYIVTLICTLIAILMNGFRIYIKYYALFLLPEIYIGVFSNYERYAHSMLGITLFLLLYTIFRNVKRNVVCKISDKYSYYVYIVHHAFIFGPFSLMALTTVDWVNCIIVIILIVMSVSILYFLSNGINTLVKKDGIIE